MRANGLALLMLVMASGSAGIGMFIFWCALDINSPYAIICNTTCNEADLSQFTPQQIDDMVFIKLPTLPDTHPGKPAYLEGLGATRLDQFHRTGNIQDIEESVCLFSRALWLTPKGHPDVPQRLSNLAGANHSRFEHLGEYRNLEVCINCMYLAVSLTPKNKPLRATLLANLGMAYESRFHLLGSAPDIHNAITFGLEAVSSVSDRHADKPNWLNSLGVSYTRRFGYLGTLEDIDDAIACQTKADLLAVAGHPSRSKCLNNLGQSHRLRFERLHETEDINKAINYGTRAVRLTPEGHPDKRGQLHNLGLSYSIRFHSSQNVENINLAIKYQEQAMTLTPNEHPDKPTQLNDLGISYRYRFEYSKELKDIDRSINRHARSVSLTPGGHSKLPNRLSNLGLSHSDRYSRLGERLDIDKAIEYLSRGLEITPHGHAEEAERAARLGSSYVLRLSYLYDYVDFALAMTCFRIAAQSTSGHPHIRFTASRMWAWLSSPLGSSEQLAGYRQAMRIVPELVWLGATVANRYENITTVASIANEAASVAIAAGELNQALEWIEEGRSIVWKQMLQLRTPFKELEAVDPILAQKLQQVARALDQADPRNLASGVIPIDSLSSEQVAQRRRRAAETWRQLIEQAQQLPGFSDFLQAKKASKLMLAARSGAVAVINVHATRCDALLLTPNGDRVTHLPLSNFSLKKAANARRKLLGLLQSMALVARGFQPKGLTNTELSIGEVLAVLWSDVAKPILEFLGYTVSKVLDYYCGISEVLL